MKQYLKTMACRDKLVCAAVFLFVALHINCAFVENSYVQYVQPQMNPLVQQDTSTVALSIDGNLNKHYTTNACGVNTTVETNGTNFCLNGYGFRTVNACRLAYEERTWHSDSKIGMINPVMYKMLLINPERKNWTVMQKLISTLDSSEIINSSSGILEICHRLPSTTVYCHKHCYSFEEFVVLKTQRLKTLYDIYEFDEYFLMNNSKMCVGAVVCRKSNSALLVFATCCLVITAICICGVLFFNLFNRDRRLSTGLVLLYHLIILTVGVVLMAVRSVGTTVYNYHYPSDECSVETSVQHFCFLIGCIGSNVNIRQILRILQEDRTFTDDARQQERQAQVTARLFTLVLWFIFILLTFVGDLLYNPDEFYPVSTIHCWYRFSNHPLFILYASWMAMAVMSTIIISVFLMKEFFIWKDAKFVRRIILIKTCLHTLAVVIQVLCFWLFLNWILPWRTSYSTSAGIIDLCKAVQAIFICVTYIWDTSKLTTLISVIISKYACRCVPTTWLKS